MQHWQNYLKDEASKGPATAREVAKAFLQQFVLLDWPLEAILSHYGATGGDWHLCIGGPVEDLQTGERHVLGSQQLAVTLVNNTPCFSVYEVPDLIAEIRREVGKEPEHALRCLACGAMLDNKPTGRIRHYCSDKCKQTEHRKFQRARKRAATLEQHSDLCNFWQEQHIGDELLALLQDILIDQGEEAARAATTAILAYVKAEQERAAQEQQEQSQARKVSKKRNK